MRLFCSPLRPRVPGRPAGHRTGLRAGARSLLVAVTATATLSAAALAYADGGVDVSHWQGTVNWNRVGAGNVTFAFMKATEGTYYTDPSLRRNWAGAKRVGIFRAAYHFARPSTTRGSAAAQARYFVSKAGTFGDAGDLPPILDLEASGGLRPAALEAWVASWLTTTRRLTGRMPILYFSPSFWTDHMGNSSAFSHYPLWIANYTTGAPRIPSAWRSWTFWQHTSVGHVAGIAGNVDLNVFNGTGRQLAALANSTGGSNTPPPSGPTLPAGAATSTTLVSGAGHRAVARGQSVSLRGALRTTTPVAAVRRRTVTLWQQVVGRSGWTSDGTAVTNRYGHFGFSVPVRTAVDYQARYAADATYAASRSPVVRLQPSRVTAGLDLHKTHVVVRAGAPLMLYGHLTIAGHGLAHRTVRYYKRSPGGSWVYVGRSTSVPPTGWHSIVVHPQVSRTWKVVFRGSARYLPVRSHYLHVTVP